MNSKTLVLVFLVCGVLLVVTECARLAKRDADDFQNDDDDDDDTSDDADLRQEKRAIQNFLEDEDDASQFLENSRSRRLFSDQKSHMKEAKKKYEEKCERLLHPRYCPDLATWPAWNQAFNSASGKK